MTALSASLPTLATQGHRKRAVKPRTVALSPAKAEPSAEPATCPTCRHTYPTVAAFDGHLPQHRKAQR